MKKKTIEFIMNVSPRSSGNAKENYTILKESNQGRLLHNSDAWANDSKVHQTKSLAFLPILGFIIFVVCSLLKFYKWSRDSARWKARGDVEFGDEAEVNYGIIQAGDKDFCQIDILSDGASVYDTVNSMRFFSNGYAAHMSDFYPYHDTVTSYKSLLGQKAADGCQYDTVKSYRAFFQKGTQSRDLAVQSQLLESSPVRSKSISHCCAQEGERSEMFTRTSTTTLLKKQLSKDGQSLQFESKRSRRRRASGDISTTKKRSVSQPSSQWINNPVCSLPSVDHTNSCCGDSEDILQNFRLDRNTYVSRKKRVLHSSSSAKMMTFPSSSCHSAPCTHRSTGAGNFPKRRRHFSADSVRYLRKATVNNINQKYFCKEDLSNSFNIAAGIQMIMRTKPFGVQVPGSPEHPNTSHSLDVPAALISGSDPDINANKHTPLSIVSNGHILESHLLASLHAGAKIRSTSELTKTSTRQSSSELTKTSPRQSSSEMTKTLTRRSLSESRTLISHAGEEFFKNKLNNAFLLKPKDTINSGSVTCNRDSKNCPRAKIVPADCSQISNNECRSMCLEDRISVDLQCVQCPSLSSSSKCLCMNKKRNLLASRKQQNFDTVETNTSENVKDGAAETSTKCNLYQVQRFQVTYVNAKMSSFISDGAKPS